jgi:hypothetical protein
MICHIYSVLAPLDKHFVVSVSNIFVVHNKNPIYDLGLLKT